MWDKVLAILTGKPVDTRKEAGNFLVAAKVLTVEKHPNADRLRIARLSDGTNEHYPVVCGAPNLAEGQIVALALPGFKVPRKHGDDTGEEFILQKATIRGVESQGMLCSRFELGLSTDKEEGIWVLPEGTPLGSKPS